MWIRPPAWARTSLCEVLQGLPTKTCMQLPFSSMRVPANRILVLGQAELALCCQVDICLDKHVPPQPIACPNKRANSCGNILLKPLGSQTMQSIAAEKA